MSEAASEVTANPMPPGRHKPGSAGLPVSVSLRICRPYIYELDLLRPGTAVTVVAVHVLAFTQFLNHTTTGLQVQNGLITSVYFGRPFSGKRCWAKRSIGVLLPYCLWSIAYTWVNTSQHSPGAFAKLALYNILTGNASYQLYYILLTLQLYLVLPLFLLFLRYIQKHPWRTLSISFALQVLFLYVDYRYLQQGSLASSGVWHIVAESQDSFDQYSAHENSRLEPPGGTVGPLAFAMGYHGIARMVQPLTESATEGIR